MRSSNLGKSRFAVKPMMGQRDDSSQAEINPKQTPY